MKHIAYALVLPLAIATPASARNIMNWECGPAALEDRPSLLQPRDNDCGPLQRNHEPIRRTETNATADLAEGAMISRWSLAIFLALTATSAASVANARDDEPSWEVIKEFASNYMRQFSQQGLSARETANQLASSIWWSEKVQVLCPSYFYVNARRARYDYLLRQGTWHMMFNGGKTATSILNEAAARRNEEFNNVPGAAKGAWCESVKAFGIKHFDWGPLFEVD